MMYLPLWLNLTSEIEEMISEKNDRLLGSSGSSKTAGEEGTAVISGACETCCPARDGGWESSACNMGTQRARGLPPLGMA